MSCRLAIIMALFVIFPHLLPASEAAGVWEEIWIDVPFVKQEKNGCGSASIAMVMQYWLKQQGHATEVREADAWEIQRALYAPGANGIYASAMKRYLEGHGFRAFSFRGEWSDLNAHIVKGRPLIVALKQPGFDGSLHYVVVAGLDLEREIVFLNDPAQRKLLKQDRIGFEKQWSATENWTLLALPQAADR